MVHLISYHIFERKWNWPTIVLKYFVSEKIISTKNGGGGTHLARSLNSKFLKGLTHSDSCKNNYNNYIETEQWLFQQTRVKGIYFW